MKEAHKGRKFLCIFSGEKREIQLLVYRITVVISCHFESFLRKFYCLNSMHLEKHVFKLVIDSTLPYVLPLYISDLFSLWVFEVVLYIRSYLCL